MTYTETRRQIDKAISLFERGLLSSMETLNIAFDTIKEYNDSVCWSVDTEKQIDREKRLVKYAIKSILKSL